MPKLRCPNCDAVAIRYEPPVPEIEYVGYYECTACKWLGWDDDPTTNKELGIEDADAT